MAPSSGEHFDPVTLHDPLDEIDSVVGRDRPDEIDGVPIDEITSETEGDTATNDAIRPTRPPADS